MSVIKKDQWSIFWKYGKEPNQQKDVGNGFGPTAQAAIEDFLARSQAQCRKGQVSYQREGLVAHRVEVEDFKFKTLTQKSKSRKPAVNIGQCIPDWPARRANESGPFIPR